MDTHKEFSSISYVLDGYGQQAQHLGKIPSRKNAIEKLVRQMQSKYPKATLHFTYEAGPCGYWMYRLLSKLGQLCYIVAPSLIPKKPGDRVKTDKRDSLQLASLLKNGDLTAINVPAAEDEAIRVMTPQFESKFKSLVGCKEKLKHAVKALNLKRRPALTNCQAIFH